MGSYNAPRKRSRLSPANIDALVELNLASSSKPRKSPRLMEHAQSQDLMQAQNEKANRKHDSYFGLRISPKIIDQAQHQQLEHSENRRKGKLAEHRIYERIRNTFMSENDRVSNLEQRRIRDREKRSALTEDKIERNRERCRNAYLKQRQKKVEGDINQRTSANGASTSTSSTSQIDRANKQYAVTTDVGEPNHSGKGSTSAQDNAKISGNTIFIPRRSPRIAEKVQGQEHLDDIEKEKVKKRFHESVDSENSSQETKRQEMHRTAQTARRSSLTEGKRAYT